MTFLASAQYCSGYELPEGVKQVLFTVTFINYLNINNL